MRPGDRLRLALHHASLGRDVFPFSLQPAREGGGRRAKTPLVRWTREASSDEAAVRAMWAEHPLVLSGWRLSVCLAVLDVDDEAAFAAAGLELPATATQATPGGGSHHLLSYDPALVEVRQTVKEVPGADTRVGGKGWVGLYSAGSFSGPVAEAPGWLHEGSRAPRASEGDEGGRLGTRSEILAWLGGLRRAGTTGPEMLAALRQAREDGRVEDLDDSRPWEDSDLRTLAREAARWDPGEAGWRSVTIRHVGRSNGRAPETLDEADPIAHLGARLGTDVDTSPPPPLLLGHLEPRAGDQTIAYGPASVGKGVIAGEWAARLTREHGMRVLVVDFEGHASAWARKVEAFRGDLARLLIVEPYGTNWRGAHGSILKKARDLRALAEAFGADFMVVDSIAAACGTDVSGGNTEPVNQYGEALQHVGVPALSLAHVGRSADLRYPFGSIFWHAWARTTWSIVESGTASQKGTEDDDVSGDGPRVVQNRKSNDRPRAASQSVDWSWVHDGLPTGGLRWSDYKMPTWERIVAALLAARRPMGPSDLARELSEDGFGPITAQAVGKVSTSHPEVLSVDPLGKVSLKFSPPPRKVHP